jgi:hypothetical protein
LWTHLDDQALHQFDALSAKESFLHHSLILDPTKRTQPVRSDQIRNVGHERHSQKITRWSESAEAPPEKAAKPRY